MTMTREEKRVAIAWACGWTRVSNLGNGPVGLKPPFRGWLPLPDYLNDLNAMHEAEKVLSKKKTTGNSRSQWEQYVDYLADMCEDSCPIDATATQRAEAFLEILRTMVEAGEFKPSVEP
jgi:hypothetical protein